MRVRSFRDTPSVVKGNQSPLYFVHRNSPLPPRVNPSGKATEAPTLPQRVALRQVSFSHVPARIASYFCPNDRCYHPSGVQREIEDRPIKELIYSVLAAVPGAPPCQGYIPGKPVPDFQTGAEIAIVWRAAVPALANVGKQADIGILISQPARASMSR